MLADPARGGDQPRPDGSARAEEPPTTGPNPTRPPRGLEAFPAEHSDENASTIIRQTLHAYLTPNPTADVRFHGSCALQKILDLYAAIRTLNLVVRSLDPKGTGQPRWAMR
ncbi:hypothetical protein [Lapillicoccus sp.]|uniref:hypothetical protein n=1 Tax=Lapillicoccus sp. TaxID=1909287 RepID=UPI00326390EC